MLNMINQNKMDRITSKEEFKEEYNEFKDAMISMAQSMISETKGTFEPVAMIAITNQVIDELKKRMPDHLKEKFKDMEKEIADATGGDKKEIYVVSVPLGKFMLTDVRPGSSELGRVAASNMIRGAVEKSSKNDMMDVKIYCYMSEIYMAKVDESDPMHNDLISGKLKASDHSSAVEKFMCLFETRYSQEIIIFDILRNEDTGYAELINSETMDNQHAKAAGLFAGILYEKDVEMPNQN